MEAPWELNIHNVQMLKFTTAVILILNFVTREMAQLIVFIEQLTWNVVHAT